MDVSLFERTDEINFNHRILTPRMRLFFHMIQKIAHIGYHHRNGTKRMSRSTKVMVKKFTEVLRANATRVSLEMNIVETHPLITQGITEADRSNLSVETCIARFDMGKRLNFMIDQVGLYKDLCGILEEMLGRANRHVRYTRDLCKELSDRLDVVIKKFKDDESD